MEIWGGLFFLRDKTVFDSKLKRISVRSNQKQAIFSQLFNTKQFIFYFDFQHTILNSRGFTTFTLT